MATGDFIEIAGAVGARTVLFKRSPYNDVGYPVAIHIVCSRDGPAK